ncbi:MULTISPECIES: hypothetical protein [unclassified Streptomyces]|uniref:hypothetical protein n=1 Tax=unclassified Streptomyces TaxID=2593676 RepID=UPI00225340AC|nr:MULTISPECIES: hypothetical protein [unclassified Streptomyces]MCX4525470.1 hypothetical protein [Streptomyces sp. NBC_01551]MCX4544058.1 hypothetical protein [Streptomyces sp. NBC_01565]
MDIPSVIRWIMAACAAVQLVYAVRALRPALSAQAGERVDAWLAFADPAAGIPVTLALAFGNWTLFLCGMALLGPVLTWQLIRTITSRRSKPAPTA